MLELTMLRPVITLLFAVLGIFGAAVHYRRDRVSRAYVLALFGVFSLGLTFYMNFEYGYTYPLDVDYDTREVRERDYFFIVSFSVWGIWAGVGIASLWHALAERLAAAPVLGLALLPLALNHGWASRHGDYMAEDWAYNVLMSVGPYGVLFTNGDNDTFLLWHLQEVEGVRRDVTVIVGTYLGAPWSARQLRDLTRPCATASAHATQPTRIICQRRSWQRALPTRRACRPTIPCCLLPFTVRTGLTLRLVDGPVEGGRRPNCPARGT